MTIRVAINGYGRIGRNILRAFVENQEHYPMIEVVAINDPAPLATSVHLTRYDSTFGPLNAEVKEEGGMLVVNDNALHYSQERDLAALPWKDLNIDVVFECTGLFTERSKAEGHLKAGAKKVIISAPGKNVDKTIVFGVNDNSLTDSDVIISNASCTTNCLTPVVKPLYDAIGIERGLMVTIHAYTNDQVLLDRNHKDIRRARAATQSLIPTKTGAAAAVGQVMPELNGKLDGYAIRVPTQNVSVVDLTFTAGRNTTVDEVNQILQNAANKELKGVLAYNTEPLVSIDFNHNPHSSIFDATQTRVIDNLVKVISWYDNEWGFSNRMLDVTAEWLG